MHENNNIPKDEKTTYLTVDILEKLSRSNFNPTPNKSFEIHSNSSEKSNNTSENSSEKSFLCSEDDNLSRYSCPGGILNIFRRRTDIFGLLDGCESPVNFPGWDEMERLNAMTKIYTKEEFDEIQFENDLFQSRGRFVSISTSTNTY